MDLLQHKLHWFSEFPMHLARLARTRFNPTSNVSTLVVTWDVFSIFALQYNCWVTKNYNKKLSLWFPWHGFVISWHYFTGLSKFMLLWCHDLMQLEFVDFGVLVLFGTYMGNTIVICPRQCWERPTRIMNGVFYLQ